jgi:hypothetical protein
MVTSTPLGTLDMVPVEKVFDCKFLLLNISLCMLIMDYWSIDIDSMIGTSSQLYAACTS